MAKLSDLIAQFDANETTFNAAVAYTDSVLRTPEADEAWRQQDAALEVLMADVLVVCRYRPASPAEQSDKARFLLKWIGGIDSLSGDEARALLRSMIEENGNG